MVTFDLPSGRSGALPPACVARLPEYLRALHTLNDSGIDTVSSEHLASAAGVSSTMLRKDLSLLGASGMRGIGYDVTNLTNHLSRVLGLTKVSRVALIGLGHLGQALARYPGFQSKGFHIAALFDIDDRVIGRTIVNHTVLDVGTLEDFIETLNIDIAVIATPEHAAQTVADVVVKAGITSILNFAPCLLTVPDGVAVRKVDVAVELQLLSFHEHHKDPDLVVRQETKT